MNNDSSSTDKRIPINDLSIELPAQGRVSIFAGCIRDLLMKDDALSIEFMSFRIRLNENTPLETRHFETIEALAQKWGYSIFQYEGSLIFIPED